jgi:transcriptional antiterminator NusG
MEKDTTNTELEARWYILHCYSGQEDRVKKNLDQRVETMGLHKNVFEVVVPTEEEVEVKDGERHTVEKKMYAGYILVSMALDDQTWFDVRNTPGVTGFISAEDEKDTRPKPVPLSDSEVEHIFSRMNADSPRVRVGFSEGDSVKITDGPFAEFLGTVEYVDEDKGKARVLVSFFGRDTPVDLDFLQLERN